MFAALFCKYILFLTFLFNFNFSALDDNATYCMNFYYKRAFENCFKMTMFFFFSDILKDYTREHNTNTRKICKLIKFHFKTKSYKTYMI